MTLPRPEVADLPGLWAELRRHGVPQRLAIPFLLRLAGSSVADVARGAGTHRTWVHTALAVDGAPPLQIHRPLVKRLGFDPWATRTEPTRMASACVTTEQALLGGSNGHVRMPLFPADRQAARPADEKVAARKPAKTGREAS